MANYTKNYNLVLPEQDDYYDVAQFNSNADAIDAQMAETEQKIAGLNPKLDTIIQKIGTLDTLIQKVSILDTLIQQINALDNKIGTISDIGTNTLYGLLNTRKDVFKSWNRYTYINATTTLNGSVAIQPVNPARCFVLVERISTSDGVERPYSYTLTESSIEVSHNNWTISGTINLAFTVIELY